MRTATPRDPNTEAMMIVFLLEDYSVQPPELS